MSQTNNPRRKFLKDTIKGAVVTTVAASVVTDALASGASKKPWTLANDAFNQHPLPYSYNGLEDIIDAQTMEIHYTKHAAAYSKNLIEAATAEHAAEKSVEDILSHVSLYSAKMRNNAGGHYNHEMFWKCMRPKRVDNKPSGKLMAEIIKHFGSFDKFKTQFADAGKSRFGSGWAWLYVDNSQTLRIGSTANQDNPLMDVSEIKGFPLLGLDVWEHAYYLKYQNRRPDYINNWWDVVNWDYVAERAHDDKIIIR